MLGDGEEAAAEDGANGSGEEAAAAEGSGAAEEEGSGAAEEECEEEEASGDDIAGILAPSKCKNKGMSIKIMKHKIKLMFLNKSEKYDINFR